MLNNGISRNLGLSVGAIISLILGFALPAEYQRHDRMLQEDFQATAGRYAESISDLLGFPIWTFDRTNIVQISAAFHQIGIVTGVLIRAPDGNLVYQTSGRGAGAAADRLQRDEPVDHEGERVGTVELAFSAERYRTQLRYLLRSQLTSTGLPLCLRWWEALYC